NLKNASRGLGSSRIQTFFKITFPLTIPGMIAGSVLVFSLSTGSYITPLLVGGRMQPLLSLSVYSQIMQTFNLPLAAAMSFTLLIAVIIVIGALGFALKRWEARMHG